MLAHTSPRDEAVEVDRDHDRTKDRLLAEDDPVLRALGISDEQGRVKPTRQAKYRQVEEFLRLLDASLGEALGQGHVRTPTEDDPLRIVDLGCGNAYLTFAAHRYLVDVRGLPVRVTGVDVKQQSADHNTAVAAGLGIDADFVVGSITDATPRPGARRGAGPARVRHGDRRRAGPRPGLGGGTGARRAVLPPRHRIAAADDAPAGALRDAHP